MTRQQHRRLQHKSTFLLLKLVSKNISTGKASSEGQITEMKYDCVTHSSRDRQTVAREKKNLLLDQGACFYRGGENLRSTL